MKAIEKLAAAALSLTITFMGLALVTAPVIFAGSAPALTGVHVSRPESRQFAAPGQAKVQAPARERAAA